MTQKDIHNDWSKLKPDVTMAVTMVAGTPVSQWRTRYVCYVKQVTRTVTATAFMYQAGIELLWGSPAQNQGL